MADISEPSTRDFARFLATFWENHLGGRLIGVYLLGSLAHGGFSARYSDIDMALIAEQGITPEDQALMRQEAAALSPAHAAKLSPFWTDRSFAIGRFPPLDRIDYLDHAVALIERERVQPARPTRAAIRDYLGGLPFANWASDVRRFITQGALEPDARKPYLRAHLYPARFIYSWSTGAMGSNDEAVAFLRGHAPPGLELDLIERALRCRQELQDPDPLFAERGKLLLQLAACAKLMEASP